VKQYLGIEGHLFAAALYHEVHCFALLNSVIARFLQLNKRRHDLAVDLQAIVMGICMAIVYGMQSTGLCVGQSCATTASGCTWVTYLNDDIAGL
jgi:hypothetical protein